MEEQKKQPEKLRFSKKIVCMYCKHEPTPPELGKPCSKCGGKYAVVDKIQQRQPFAVDRRQTGGI